MKISRGEPADRFPLKGLDTDKNAIRRIKAGRRFVTDIELVIIAKVLKVDSEHLLKLKGAFCNVPFLLHTGWEYVSRSAGQGIGRMVPSGRRR